MKQMLFQKKVDEVDGELPPEVETTLIETDSTNESNEIETVRDTEEGVETIIHTEDDEEDDKPLELTRETQWCRKVSKCIMQRAWC